MLVAVIVGLGLGLGLCVGVTTITPISKLRTTLFLSVPHYIDHTVGAQEEGHGEAHNKIEQDKHNE